MYLDRKFGRNLSLSEITLLFDLSLYLDRTLAQRKAQRKAMSEVKVAHCLFVKRDFLVFLLFKNLRCQWMHSEASVLMVDISCSYR